MSRDTVMPARVLIIDDEPHARRYLRKLLESEPRVEIVGECPDGFHGSQQIQESSPDIVFLDVQMPELDGFSMIERIDKNPRPAFIFVTGYNEYAIRAFEVEAVDYVCKPFDSDRISVAVERALRRLRVPGVSEKPWLSRLSIKDGERIVFLPVDEVVWIEAADKYVVIHTATESLVSRQTIQGLEEQLDPREFVRIHRSTLVRKAAVRGLNPLFHGDYVVKLVNGAEVTLSRSFRASFFRAMSR